MRLDHLLSKEYHQSPRSIYPRSVATIFFLFLKARQRYDQQYLDAGNPPGSHLVVCVCFVEGAFSSAG